MSPEPSKGTLTNIVEQIGRGIQVCLENDCHGSALILIYSAIDAMAFLGLPEGRDEVKADDYIKWCERYMPLCADCSVTGDELYSARCGIVHTYAIDSRRTRSGACRLVGYADRMEPPVRYVPSIDKNFVLVSIAALADGLFSGMDKFLVDRFSDQTVRPIIEKRLDRLYKVFRT